MVVTSTGGKIRAPKSFDRSRYFYHLAHVPPLVMAFVTEQGFGGRMLADRPVTSTQSGPPEASTGL
jgi:hypothetical protein